MEIKSDFFHFQMNEGDELQILVKKRKKENFGISPFLEKFFDAKALEIKKLIQG
ncbi:MAG: hypothetical protein RL293_1781, partial [Bacteroidota bacterium]